MGRKLLSLTVILDLRAENLLVGNQSLYLNQLATKHLGSVLLPILPAQHRGTPKPNGNVTIFTLACDGSVNRPRWCFKSTSAHLSLGTSHVHSSGGRSTIAGTLARDNSEVEVGVQAYTYHDRNLDVYLRLAQSSCHVAVNLHRFRDALLYMTHKSDFTEQEWQALLSLRVRRSTRLNIRGEYDMAYASFYSFRRTSSG